MKQPVRVLGFVLLLFLWLGLLATGENACKSMELSYYWSFDGQNHVLTLGAREGR
jgi:hypothetical protein